MPSGYKVYKLYACRDARFLSDSLLVPVYKVSKWAVVRSGFGPRHHSRYKAESPAKSVTNLFTLLSVLVDSAVKKSWWLKVQVLYLSVGVVGFVQI